MAFVFLRRHALIRGVPVLPDRLIRPPLLTKPALFSTPTLYNSAPKLAFIYFPEPGAMESDNVQLLDKQIPKNDSLIGCGDLIFTFKKMFENVKIANSLSDKTKLTNTTGKRSGRISPLISSPLGPLLKHGITGYSHRDGYLAKRGYASEVEPETENDSTKGPPDNELPTHWQQRIEKCEREFFLAKGEWKFAKWTLGLAGGGFVVKLFWDLSEHEKTRKE